MGCMAMGLYIRSWPFRVADNEQFLCEMQCEPTSLSGAPALLFTKQATVQTEVGMCPLDHVCK